MRKDRAVETLVWYFKTVFTKAGLDWNSDNTTEVRQMVEDIIQAAIEP